VAQDNKVFDLHHGYLLRTDLCAGVHTTRVAKKFEWFGLTLLKRYLEKNVVIRDVHDNPQYYSKGIDLIVQGKETFSIDLKTDSYMGTDPMRKIKGQCNPDSGVMLIETISQLQYNRNKSDVPGWFFTSEADEIYYYYLAVLNEAQELTDIHSEYKMKIKSKTDTRSVEDNLIKALKVDNDMLVTYNLKKARKWLSDNIDELKISYSGATNPTYVTVSLRIPRELFLEPSGPGRNLGRVYPKILE